MAKDKDAIDVEVKEIKSEQASKEENKEEPKKENGFKKFWNKTKQSISDSMLESKIENTFNNNNIRADVYEHDKLLSTCIYGYFEVEDTTFVCFGKHEFDEYVVLVEDENEKAYYVVSTAPTKVTVDVEGEKYERDATAITLDKNVEEVKVVRAGKRYFIYKGK